MNQLPENSLRRYDVTSVTSYLIGLHGIMTVTISVMGMTRSRWHVTHLGHYNY